MPIKISARILNSKFITYTMIFLLIISFSLFAFLAYYNLSPSAALLFIRDKINPKTEFYDNTKLFSFSKPVEHFETVSKIFEVIKESNELSSVPETFGIDVTNKFNDYQEFMDYFFNLSKIVTTWDNKFLAYNDNKLFLFQITGKKIFLRSLEVPNINEIEFAFIFKNGNILVCDYKNAYYSDDNLLTIKKSTVLDINGNQYIPNEYGNFFSLTIDGRQFAEENEIRVWGNYVNYGSWYPGSKRSEQVHVWYTIDYGKTIKMAYQFGVSQPALTARHIHSVNMCPWDNSFWVQTGDLINECNWLQGSYSIKEDKWSWKVIATGDEMSHFKSTGFVFYNDYVYWSDDSSNPENHGIWRTPYSNLTSEKIKTDLFEKVFDTDKEIMMLTGNNDGFMIASQYFLSGDYNNKIFLSSDGGLNWKIVNSSLQVINIHPPNSFKLILGNYFINQASFEAVHYWDFGPSFFINSYYNE